MADDLALAEREAGQDVFHSLVLCSESKLGRNIRAKFGTNGKPANFISEAWGASVLPLNDARSHRLILSVLCQHGPSFRVQTVRANENDEN
jgi:hypothetical protein